jgi:hypothetical protein
MLITDIKFCDLRNGKLQLEKTFIAKHVSFFMKSFLILMSLPIYIDLFVVFLFTSLFFF